MSTKNKVPPFLEELLNARSPTGAEYEAQAVVDQYMEPIADNYRKDTMGNRIAELNMKGDPVVMLAGHMDELGFMVKYIDRKGFIYFDRLGGHDISIISGRRVRILTAKGDVVGVTGKRAIHLMTPEERVKLSKPHEIWIDIGAKDDKEAKKLVSIGDTIVYDHSLEELRNGRFTARAFDDKAGCYVVCETLRRLAKSKSKLAAKVVSVATTQEEIGTRGAIPTSFSVEPHIGIAVDVGHATDHPNCDFKKHGEFYLGQGPIITRGPNANPFVFDRLTQVAKKLKIPYQIEPEAGPTGTDGRSIQISRSGVATGVISIPLRYMHTPSEIVDINDIEYTIKLLEGFIKSLKKGERGLW